MKAASGMRPIKAAAFNLQHFSVSNISLDNRNPIGYSFNHDKIFYP